MRMPYWRNLLAILLLLVVLTTKSVDSTSKCVRNIEEVTVPPSNADEKYHISVTLFNRTDVVFSYMPDTKYTVSIIADSHGPIPRKFTRFMVFAESKDENNTTADVGVFDVIDEVMTKFADRCANAITETSKVPKGEVSVAWTSPSEGSGCILIRAVIVETADTWYMDDANLAVNMCQDTKAEADDQGPVLAECCACDEAKYEVTFEGLWSRNTHPKDFPSKGWLIRFSDVIGASHTVDYHFWTYDGLASPGLKQVAELGSTRTLESELKNQSEHIRTIIKARGISYPNVTGRTFAVFRVDRKHHLMSLVSMLDPSPDWIVGVSGLELCLSNCSWIEHKELNLYPYDAGTDDGITYLSPDSPTEPQELIRRITSSYPNDSRSPFYDPSGLDMKPLARLYLNRQRLYEKACDDKPNENADTGGKKSRKRKKKHKACRVSPWGSWSTCSVTCGIGNKLRQRHYRNQTAADAMKCNTTLTDRVPCNAQACENTGQAPCILNTEICCVTDWDNWSSCTTSCGSGSRTRSRNFVYKKYRKQCMAAPCGPELQQTISCENKPCSNEDLEEVSAERNNEENEEEGKKDNKQEEEEEEGEEKKEGEEEGEVEEDEDENEEDEEEGMDEQETEENGVEEQADGQIKDDVNYENDQPDLRGRVKWLQKCPEDRYTPWSLWSPCSSSCGPGMKIRSRLENQNWSKLDSEEENMSLEECKVEQASCTAEIATCDISEEEAEKICSEPMVTGNCSTNIKRTYFDKQTGKCEYFTYSGCDGNRNNFETIQDCDKVCGNYQKKFKGLETKSQIIESSELRSHINKVDCQVSEWSDWSPCLNCRGRTYKTRQILVPSKRGDKKCPRKKYKYKPCRKVLPRCSFQQNGITNQEKISDTTSIDCQLTSWSSWSHCSATCGISWQQRMRTIKIQPRGFNAKLCGPLVEFRNCTTIECL